MTNTEYNARPIYSTGKFDGRRWVFFTEGVDDGASPAAENCRMAGKLLRPGERWYVIISIGVEMWFGPWRRPTSFGYAARIGQWLVLKFGTLEFVADSPDAVAQLLHNMRLPLVRPARSLLVGADNAVSAEVRLPRVLGWLLRRCPFLRPSTIRINLDGVAVSERAQEYLQ